MTVVLKKKATGICEKLQDRTLRDTDWTRELPIALGGLGLRSAEPLKEIASVVTEKKTELQTVRVEANWTCRIWRKDEQEKMKLQIVTEGVTDDGDVRQSLCDSTYKTKGCARAGRKDTKEKSSHSELRTGRTLGDADTESFSTLRETSDGSEGREMNASALKKSE